MPQSAYPPINHPVIDPKTGLLTVPWRNYFEALSTGILPGAGGIIELTGNVTAGPGVGSQVATIAPLAVTTARLANLAVTTGKIADDAVTYAKIQNVSAASRLLGRGSAAGAGDVEEITLGTNLTMAGTVLNAAGGSGTDTWARLMAVMGA